MAHTSGHTVLTVDRMVPPPDARICPAFDFGTHTPERSGSWRVAPDILVCHRGPVSMTRVRKAVEFWEKIEFRRLSMKLFDFASPRAALA